MGVALTRCRLYRLQLRQTNHTSRTNYKGESRLGNRPEAIYSIEPGIVNNMYVCLRKTKFQ